MEDMTRHAVTKLYWKESSFLCVLHTWLWTVQRHGFAGLPVNHFSLGEATSPTFHSTIFPSISSNKSSWLLNLLFFPITKQWNKQLWSMLGQDYSTCIIGVPDRRYLWIMARTPSIEENKLQALIAKSRSLGWIFGLREMEGTDDPFFQDSQLFLISLWEQSSTTLVEIWAALGRLWWQGDCSGATRGGCQLRSWCHRAMLSKDGAQSDGSLMLPGMIFAGNFLWLPVDWPVLLRWIDFVILWFFPKFFDLCISIRRSFIALFWDGTWAASLATDGLRATA